MCGDPSRPAGTLPKSDREIFLENKNHHVGFGEGQGGYGIISTMQPTIIGVRFTRIGKIYHFDSSTMPDVGVGEHVIVDTSRGRAPR